MTNRHTFATASHPRASNHPPTRWGSYVKCIPSVIFEHLSLLALELPCRYCRLVSIYRKTPVLGVLKRLIIVLMQPHQLQYDFITDIRCKTPSSQVPCFPLKQYFAYCAAFIVQYISYCATVIEQCTKVRPQVGTREVYVMWTPGRLIVG